MYALIIRALQVHEYSTTFIDKKKFEIVRHQLKMRKKTRQKVKITLISVLSLQKKKDQHQIISSSKSTPIRCNFSSIAGQVFIRINLVFEIGLGIIITRMQQGRTRNIFDEDGIIYYHNAKKKKTRENSFAGNSFVQKKRTVSTRHFPRSIAHCNYSRGSN